MYFIEAIYFRFNVDPVIDYKTKVIKMNNTKMLVRSQHIVHYIGFRNLFSKFVSTENTHIQVSKEVRNALESKTPVVALESTIVTHGMPYPSNVECALDVEKIVREQVKITELNNRPCELYKNAH